MKVTSTMTPEQEAAWAADPGKLAFADPTVLLSPKAIRHHGIWRYQTTGCRCAKCVAAYVRTEARIRRRQLRASHEGKRALKKRTKTARRWTAEPSQPREETP